MIMSFVCLFLALGSILGGSGRSFGVYFGAFQWVFVVMFSKSGKPYETMYIACFRKGRGVQKTSKIDPKIEKKGEPGKTRTYLFKI